MIDDYGKAGKARWLLVLLVLGIGIAYLLVMGEATGGRPVAPLDDSYIFYQYARQIARGHAWQYNDGDPYSTGMTSLLYPWLLAGLYTLGLQGERLVLAAVVSGILWLGGITFWTLRVWDALAVSVSHAQRWGMVAASAVVTTGAVQWGTFLGMETGLFTLLSLAALEALLRRRTGLAAFWLGLAGLTRPEGLIFAFLAWLICGGQQALGSISPEKPLTIRLLVSLCARVFPLGTAVAVGMVPLLLNGLLTGTFSATGLQAKSCFYNVPLVWGDILRSVALTYTRVFIRALNGWGTWRRATFGSLVTPGLTILAGVGWGVLALRRRWFPLLLTASWFWLGTLSTATLITATWHLGRYQVPFIPVAVILAVAGIAALWDGATRRGRGWRLLVSLLLIGLLASALLSTYYALVAFHRATRTVARQQLVLADWLQANLPPTARVGVHDTGSLRYVGERPTYDLVGLTTVETTRAWRHGAGSLFEQMEHSPRRPDYFAIYPGVFTVPYLAKTDLFDEELFRVEVSDHAVASAGPVQGVWRANWRLAGSGEQYYQPDILAYTADLTLVDTLGVASLHSEAAHSVEWWQDVLRPGFPTEVHQLTYRVLPEQEVLDGGRLLTGGLSFNVKTRPGESLWIVARLHAQQAGGIRVRVDGDDVGRWAYPAVSGQWLETVFRIPMEAITGHQTHISLQVDTDDPDFRHYALYHLWFLQGEAEEELAEIENHARVSFGDELSLIGFDLPEQVWHPGDVVPVTLYWRATGTAQSDAKVFLHLYDSDGNLGSQSDGRAFYGTRPPYTWRPGETVADPRPLALPANLPPGVYSLEVGLYNPDGSGRLPAYRGGVRQYEERVVLAVIEVAEQDTE